MDEMQAAYDRDYRAKRQMDELRQHIAAFVDDPPLRARASTLGALVAAARALGEEAASIVRTWD